MSDPSDLGVVYTDYPRVRDGSPIASLWSYRTALRRPDQRSVTANPDGSCDYWLEPSDPLLNTILPGTHVSVVFNFGNEWTAGSLPTSSILPRVFILGPVTRAQILRVGTSVDAVGAVVAPTLAVHVFGVPSSELVDHVMPLDDIWSRNEVNRLFARLATLEGEGRVSALKHDLTYRLEGSTRRASIAQAAAGLIRLHHGRVSIDQLSQKYGVARREFARRFRADAGLAPKLYSRITRFQTLLHMLLATDVSQWAAVSTGAGFYDQAHMINEFRDFAGAPPTIFFRVPDAAIEPTRIHLRGRPSEWRENCALTERAEGTGKASTRRREGRGA